MEIIICTLEKTQTNTGCECKDPVHRHANNGLSVGSGDLRSRDPGGVIDPRRAEVYKE